MLESILQKVELICPRCRKPAPGGMIQSPLRLKDVRKQEGKFILEGHLECENPDCLSVYPIIDGVPCIIRNVDKWSGQMGQEMDPQLILDREKNTLCDVSSFNSKYAGESLLSCYLENHYGEFAADFSPSDKCGTDPFWKLVVGAGSRGMDNEHGLSIDLGCSVGRFTFEIAGKSEIAVGMDVNFGAVRTAAYFQRTGKVTYRRKVRGSKFEEVQTAFEPKPNVLFLYGDVLDPPFRMETFDLVAGLNLLDSVKYPLVLLGQMNALLRPGGLLVLCSPYEWRPDICDPEEWLESETMDAPEMVRNILKGISVPEYGLDYQIEEEVPDLLWTMKNHDRYWSIYNVDLIIARKRK